MFAFGTLTGYFFLSRDRVILDLTVFPEAREIVVCRLGFRNNTTWIIKFAKNTLLNLSLDTLTEEAFSYSVNRVSVETPDLLDQLDKVDNWWAWNDEAVTQAHQLIIQSTDFSRAFSTCCWFISFRLQGLPGMMGSRGIIGEKGSKVKQHGYALRSFLPRGI